MKLLLLLLVAVSVAQVNDPPFPAGCNVCGCSGPGTCDEVTCATPEDCTPSLAGAILPVGAARPGCGCKCAACSSCVQAANPEFDKQCQANIVMVLDESGSIIPSVNLVRNAVVSFLSSFGTINQIGGVARLGLVEFDTNARLVNPRCNANDPAPCTTLPGNSCSGKMCTLDTNWVNAVTNYMLDDGGDNDNQKYTGGGCTNWGDALQLAANTGWTHDNTAGAQLPDIVLFFTDGMPTVHEGVCNKDCNANRDRQGTLNMKVGACYGNHVGVGCYWADSLKAQGVKMFLVGVGGISNHVPNAQIVTGPTAWDQTVGTFGTSDYVIDTDFAALGAIFYNVAKGLCQCLQDQTICSGAQCEAQSNFDARVQITTAVTSTAFPANALLEGYLYYDFLAGPARFGIDYTDNAGQLQRTDIINPCQVQRKITCGGNCFSTADVAFTPRFFRENSDQQPGPPLTGFMPSAACTTGGQVYTKEPDPSKPLEDQAILFLWTNAADIVCAARANDGTLYEFFRDAAKTVSGVNNRFPGKPQQLRLASTEVFNFAALDQCQSPTCSAEVEIVFMVDPNTGASDYYLQSDYVKRIAGTFDNANNRIAFGAYIPTPTPERIPATGMQAQLDVFGNQVLGYRPNVPSGPVNFYEAATAAINAFWPNPMLATDPPRYLLTTVGSVDAEGTWTQAQRDAYNQLRLARGVLQTWATGVGVGATQLNTLESLSFNPLALTSYTHYTTLGTSDLLATQAVDQSARMCPVSDLCGGTCQGLCLCGVCTCPTCSVPTDLCQSASCPAPTGGCAILDKRRSTMAAGGCLPDTPALREPCTMYSCDATTGTCQAPVVCTGCPCGPPSPCEFNLIERCEMPAMNTVCVNTTISCSSNLCGSVCQPATGTCVAGGAGLACNDNNGCTIDSCVVRTIGGAQQGVCQSVDATGDRCKPKTACEVTTCVSRGADEWTCNATNITSLLDLCGVCLGDFTECFFQSVNQAETAGIAGGVVAGIVIAAVAVALLVAFFAKKSYSMYMAKSAFGAGSVTTSPAFQEGGLQGYTKF